MTTEATGVHDDMMAVQLRLRPFSAVPHLSDFVVGVDDGDHVVMPPVAVEILNRLQVGIVGRDIEDDLRAGGVDVDVADFILQLVELGWTLGVDEMTDTPENVFPANDRRRPGPVRSLFSGPAWVLYVLCFAGAVVSFVCEPRLIPRASDAFFLGTPAESLAALTVITLCLAGLHEYCHLLGARAEGLKAHIRISRRLYFFTLETDLSALWAVPRRRRYSALMAGIACDSVILFVILVTRRAELGGQLHLPHPLSSLLAALTLTQLSGLIAQCFVFLRTDLYAVLMTATGCSNLWEVNRLLLREKLHILPSDQRPLLADAHPRDLAVARYFVWLNFAGLLAAAVFFVAVFLPVSVRTVTWIATSLLSASPSTGGFWEALVFGACILSPTALVTSSVLWAAFEKVRAAYNGDRRMVSTRD